MLIDNVEMRHKDRASLNYAKAKAAIHGDAKTLSDRYHNVAHGINYIQRNKKAVIDFLGGKVSMKKGDAGMVKQVEFKDGSIARY